MPRQAAVLCGGRGTRLRPHTDTTPKPMVEVLGRWGGNYYGTVEDLPRICRSESLTIPPDAIAEIALIEVMVREFHALPVQGAPGEV